MFYYHNLIVERALRALNPKCNRPIKKCGVPTMADIVNGRPSTCFLYEVGEVEETDSGAFLNVWTVTIRTGSKQAYCACPDHVRGMKLLCTHIASVLYYERDELMPFASPEPNSDKKPVEFENQTVRQVVEEVLLWDELAGGTPNPAKAKAKLLELRARWNSPAYRQSRYGSPDFLPAEGEDISA